MMDSFDFYELNKHVPAQYFDEENDILLYQGDCKTILPKLAEVIAGKVDLTLSDPPYGISYQSNHRTSEDILGKAIANDADLEIIKDVCPFIDTLMGEDTALYFFAHPNMIGENRLIFDQYWKYKNLLVWDKGDAGTFGDLKAGYSLNYENIFYYNKGRRELNGARPRTIIRYDFSSDEARRMSTVDYDEFLSVISSLIYNLPEELAPCITHNLPQDIINAAMREHPKNKIRQDWSSRNDPVHPTVKSIPLLCTLVKNSSNEGDVVLDPFLGSGTCAAAAKATGRRFIGIELQPQFFNVSIDRVTNQPLFAKSKPEPVQEGMFE